VRSYNPLTKLRTAPIVLYAAGLTSGSIPANRHFQMIDIVGAPSFGRFVNLATHGTQQATFTLWVDNLQLASKNVSLPVD